MNVKYSRGPRIFKPRSKKANSEGQLQKEKKKGGDLNQLSHASHHISSRTRTNSGRRTPRDSSSRLVRPRIHLPRPRPESLPRFYFRGRLQPPARPRPSPLSMAAAAGWERCLESPSSPSSPPAGLVPRSSSPTFVASSSPSSPAAAAPPPRRRRRLHPDGGPPRPPPWRAPATRGRCCGGGGVVVGWRGRRLLPARDGAGGLVPRRGLNVAVLLLGLYLIDGVLHRGAAGARARRGARAGGDPRARHDRHRARAARHGGCHREAPPRRGRSVGRRWRRCAPRDQGENSSSLPASLGHFSWVICSA